MGEAPKPWERISRKLLQKTIVFDLYVERLRSPRNNAEDDFYFIETVDWVNIIALTPDKQVVLVDQYRLGSREVSLELPGGMLGDPNEDPKEAALRELVEESGYQAKDAEYLGYVYPNPAIQTNRCHLYFAKNVEKVGELQQDHLEDIVVRLKPLKEIPKLIDKEEITHTLMVSAFMRLVARHGSQVFNL